MAALVLGRNALGSVREDRVIDCCLQRIPRKLLLDWWRNGYLIFFKGLIWLSGEVLGLIECTHSYLIANHLGVRNRVLPNTHPDLVPTRLFVVLTWRLDWGLGLVTPASLGYIRISQASYKVLIVSSHRNTVRTTSIHHFIVEWMDFQCYERPAPSLWGQAQKWQMKDSWSTYTSRKRQLEASQFILLIRGKETEWWHTGFDRRIWVSRWSRTLPWAAL